MRVYVTTPGARITVRGGRLIAKLEEGEPQEWPIEQVQSVSLFGPIQISGHGLSALLDAQIPLDLFTTRGRYRGSLSAGETDRLILAMAQHHRWRDEAYRLGLAIDFVSRKLANQAKLLHTAARRAESPELREALAILGKAAEGAKAAGDHASLLGYEGTGARAYFSGLRALLIEDIPFNGRSRRPPLDPPNALLSFGYTLVTTEISGRLAAEGLDPRLGFLHAFRYGRHSLALDVLEELRPMLIDRFVLTLFNQRQMQPDDFEARDGGIYLSRDGLRRWFHLYDRHLGEPGEAGSWRSHLIRRVRDLAEAIQTGRNVPPFQWDGHARPPLPP